MEAAVRISGGDGELLETSWHHADRELSVCECSADPTSEQCCQWPVDEVGQGPVILAQDQHLQHDEACRESKCET